MEVKMAMKSATTNVYLHIVTIRQADGNIDGHNVSNYLGILTDSYIKAGRWKQ